ncbi:unannotated protein [freshwater metagenome]|uniref:Unannotated protein n=1 Tax=freshwater metagenome TaxID=449393 RepID=A0A6J6EEH7_9ZZZZ
MIKAWAVPTGKWATLVTFAALGTSRTIIAGSTLGTDGTVISSWSTKSRRALCSIRSSTIRSSTIRSSTFISGAFGTRWAVFACRSVITRGALSASRSLTPHTSFRRALVRTPPTLRRLGRFLGTISPVLRAAASRFSSRRFWGTIWIVILCRTSAGRFLALRHCCAFVDSKRDGRAELTARTTTTTVVTTRTKLWPGPIHSV